MKELNYLDITKTGQGHIKVPSATGIHPDFTAGSAEQIISDEYTENKVPYLLRASGGNGSKREEDTLVGGTVAWNQLVVDGNFTDATKWEPQLAVGVTLTLSGGVATLVYNSGALSATRPALKQKSIWQAIAGHKYLLSIDLKANKTLSTAFFRSNALGNMTSFANVGTEWQRFEVVKNATSSGDGVFYIGNNGSESLSVGDSISFRNYCVCDLTQMFGSTIADYIYSLETATTGAGVAWFKALFPADYYAYNAGELKSVEGVSAHLMKDADDNVVGNYPLDSSLTLRGVPKLDANNALYYDGDIYESDGTVTRRYGIVDLGTLTWTKTASRFASNGLQGLIKPATSSDYTSGLLCPIYTPSADVVGAQTGDKEIAKYTNGNIYILDSAYSTAANFKTAMSGVYLVYELATPTTETADPYTNPQTVDPNGTEEYVTTSIVPVGHETKYFADLVERLAAIPDPPTANGTYRLIATVTGGVATLSWTNN